MNMESNKTVTQSPSAVTRRYLCVLEKTESGYSGFLADSDLVLATGRTKADVLEYLAQELQAMKKGGELPEPKSTKEDFASEEGVEFEYVAPSPPNPISLQLEELVRMSGKKQKDVASALGVTSASISRLTSPYYHGHSIDSVQRIAHALGYEVELNFKKAN